ncbi:MAG: hypothetical protein NDJ90_13375 [Oligoflexia bacterium]|nr:hypothetical protein [Oligoflexia bacterium]
MFKNYLTYQLASGFDRTCCAFDLAFPEKKELMRCSRAMLLHLDLSLRATSAADKSKNLFVALTYLRDCKGVLESTGGPIPFELTGAYEVLHARLEQLCWDASGNEGGQTRMLG